MNAHTSATRRADTADYLALFLNDVPLMDVRAPVEFNAGAFPTAINVPLLDDRQREQVGTRYKENGQEAAIALGQELATDELRVQRLQDWSRFCKEHPDGYLYCFRGGLRSHVTQDWLAANGVDYPLVQGGYKAMRRFLLAEQELSLQQVPLVVLAGPTGSGKTRLLTTLAHHVDLEGLARHRGSAFGAMLDAQPAQIGWENAVSIGFLKHRHGTEPRTPLVLEDESRLIGRVHVPPALQARMKQAPIVVLDIPLPERVQIIFDEYIGKLWPQYIERFGEQAAGEFRRFVLGNLARIRKRLGGERHERLAGLFSAALATLEPGSHALFFEAIAELMTAYYDPQYRYMLEQRSERVVFRGNAVEAQQWLQDYTGKPR